LLVGIVRPVVVEVKLAVVPVEDRSVDELTIRVRNFAFARPSHQRSNFTTQRGLYFLPPEFYLEAAFWKKRLHKAKASSISSDNTLLEAVTARTLVSIPEETKVTGIRRRLYSNLFQSIAKRKEGYQHRSVVTLKKISRRRLKYSRNSSPQVASLTPAAETPTPNRIA